jgi:hypothetical protein
MLKVSVLDVVFEDRIIVRIVFVSWMMNNSKECGDEREQE